jgi:hypothetical protein
MARVPAAAMLKEVLPEMWDDSRMVTEEKKTEMPSSLKIYWIGSVLCSNILCENLLTPCRGDWGLKVLVYTAS